MREKTALSYLERFEEYINGTDYGFYWQSFREDCQLRDLEISSIKAYAEVINYFVKYCISNQIGYADIDRRTVKQFILSFKDDVSPATVNGRLKALRRFFNSLIDDGLWGKANPLDKIPAVKQPRQHKRVLIPNDIQKMLSVCNDTFEQRRDRLALIILWDCLLRKSELLNLRKVQVNYPGRFLDILGKGRKQRYVPASMKTLRAVRKHIEKYQHHFPSEYVIASRDGSPLKDRHFLSIIKKTAKRAGLDFDINVHLVRHSAITYLLTSGKIDPVTVQLIAGHSDIRTTQGYFHPEKTATIRAYNDFSPANALKI